MASEVRANDRAQDRAGVDGAETTEAGVLDRIIGRRVSCRRFRPEPVPRADIEEVLEAARWTPSWGNGQPWRVHVVQGEAIERFRAGLILQVVAGSAPRPDLRFPTDSGGRNDAGVPGSDVELFGAPHVAIITAPSSAGAYGALDCGLFVESFVLSAQARGIATVPQAALAGRAGFIRDFLNLPDDRVILLGIALGWPDLADPDSAVPTERAAIDEFVTFVDD